MTAMIREKDVVYGLTLVWSLAAVFGGQVCLLQPCCQRASSNMLTF